MKILLVGSGLSAYGACVAFLEKKKNHNFKIDVIDIGLKESSLTKKDYVVPNSKDFEGSYFPYGINDSNSSIKLDSKRICSSHAFGGYSKVYSGSILRPKNNELINWPKDSIPKSEDYEKILSSLNFKPHKNEVSDFFLKDKLNYDYNLKNISLLGNALIAFSKIIDNDGRKIKIPFDSSYKFLEWVKEGKIEYINDSYLTQIEVKKEFLIAYIKEKNKLIKKEYSKIFLGAGCVNTTAIIDRSLFFKGSRDYFIQSSPSILQLYFKCPLKKIKDESLNLKQKDYALCKYFLEHKSRLTSGYWTHTQIGPINRIIINKLKKNLFKFLHTSISHILKIFYFSTTVLHSEIGPKILLKSKINKDKKQIIKIIEKENNSKFTNSLAIKIAVLEKFMDLYLLPIPFSNFFANKLKGNKYGGWHYGGTLPFSSKNIGRPYCDPSGEVNGLRNVYVIDSSSFPTIPGSTVALLTMANAYRIGKSCLN